MSNINELKQIISLNPFARFCCTIGNLPSSYMASLTYEEQLLWFCDYLQNTVIPAVNNNAEVVKELQELYVKLKNYVDNYFNNLDVQDEINNKLDKMVSDGTFDTIINQTLFNQINTDINNLYTKKMENTILIGDSYGNLTPNWIDLFASKMGLVLNSTFYRNASNGAGFGTGGSGGKNIMTVLTEIENNVQNKDKIVNIIICVCLNNVK